MPNYDFFCANVECDFLAIDVQLPVAGRDYPTTEPCPKCAGAVERGIAAPGVSYTAGSSIRSKTPDTFKDILRNIKKNHIHSTIDV